MYIYQELVPDQGGLDMECVSECAHGPYCYLICTGFYCSKPGDAEFLLVKSLLPPVSLHLPFKLGNEH